MSLWLSGSQQSIYLSGSADCVARRIFNCDLSAAAAEPKVSTIPEIDLENVSILIKGIFSPPYSSLLFCFASSHRTPW